MVIWLFGGSWENTVLPNNYSGLFHYCGDPNYDWWPFNYVGSRTGYILDYHSTYRSSTSEINTIIMVGDYWEKTTRVGSFQQGFSGIDRAVVQDCSRFTDLSAREPKLVLVYSLGASSQQKIPHLDEGDSKNVPPINHI